MDGIASGRTPLIETKHFPKLLVVIIILLLAVAGSVFLYTRNKNALYAKTYAYEVISSYEGVKGATVETVRSVRDAKPELVERSVQKLEKQQVLIRETIKIMQQRPAPETGENLKQSYITFLQANYQLGDTVLAMYKSGAALQGIEERDLPEVISKEKEFNTAFSNFIKTKNLSVNIPGESISDGLNYTF